MPRSKIARDVELQKLIGGSSIAFCSQCGACVGDCPSARHSERFSPRKVVLLALMGLERELLTPDSIIWDCTNCFNCYERCPQGVHPVEVIIALKNMATREGLVPETYSRMTGQIEAEGASTSMNPSMERRRRDLGLPDLPARPLDELRILLGGE